jgi:hypothetical protein
MSAVPVYCEDAERNPNGLIWRNQRDIVFVAIGRFTTTVMVQNLSGHSR